jgi:hypothetical protein
MFVITNREVDNGKRGLKKFGKKLNPEGANELRMAEAVKQGRDWKIAILPDEISPAMKRDAGIRDSGRVFASRYVARRLLARVNPGRARQVGVSGPGRRGKNLLFFVHGFNNDMKAVLDRARSLETLYGVEVVAFSWPANGGGVSGVVSYKSDKRDAKASVGALDRTLEAMYRLLGEFNESYADEIRAGAERRFPDDPEQRDRLISKKIAEGCPFTVNAIFHSMGNYLYKQLLKSGASEGNGLLFDNVVLAAADTNNENHRDWVDQIRCRKRVYVTINEDDIALKTSRIKAGEEQKARLGHYPFGLDARQAVYVQFTGADHVGDDHAYFEGDPVRKNAKINGFFKTALNGQAAEDQLTYHDATNTYHFE